MPNENRLEGAVMFLTNVADIRCESDLRDIYISRMATSESISADARTAAVKLPQLVRSLEGMLKASQRMQNVTRRALTPATLPVP